jgi:hypothetical protein
MTDPLTPRLLQGALPPPPGLLVGGTRAQRRLAARVTCRTSRATIFYGTSVSKLGMERKIGEAELERAIRPALRR